MFLHEYVHIPLELGEAGPEVAVPTKEIFERELTAQTRGDRLKQGQLELDEEGNFKSLAGNSCGSSGFGVEFNAD